MISNIVIYRWVENNWEKLVKKAQTYNNKNTTSISQQIVNRFHISPVDARNISNSVALWKGIEKR